MVSRCVGGGPLRIVERPRQIVGLLEMMREHRCKLIAPVVKQRLERRADPRMQLATARLEQQAVGCVAGEGVLEDVFALRIAGPFAHQLFIGERGDVRLDVFDPFRQRCGEADLLEHAVQKHASDDGGSLGHPFGALGEPVDARAEHAGQGLGDRRLKNRLRGAPVLTLPNHLAPVDQRAQHFLEIEGIALRALEDLRPDCLGQVLDVEEVAEQFLGGRGVERLEIDARERRAEAGLQTIDQLPAGRAPIRPQDADHQQRLEGGERCDLCDQLQRRIVRPVQIIHDKDLRVHAAVGPHRRLDGVDHRRGDAIDHGFPGERRQHYPALLGVDRQHRLVERHIEGPQMQPVDIGLKFLAQLRGGVHLRCADDLPAELAPWIIGDGLAIGDGARFDPVWLVGLGIARPLELGEQARLAQARLADDGHHRSLALAESVKALVEQRHFLVAADQRRGDTLKSSCSSRHRLDAGNLEGLDRGLLALHLDGAARIEVELGLHQPVGIGADQNRSGVRGRLQPRRNIGRVAHRGVFRPDRVADESENGGAGVDAHSQIEVDAMAALDDLRVLPGGLLNVEPGAYRPFGIVFVGDRRAEEGQNGISHQPRDRAAIARHRRVHQPERAIHDQRPVFGVELLGDRGRAGYVGKKHRGEPSLALDRALALKRITAIAAEASAVHIAELTVLTSTHSQ